MNILTVDDLEGRHQSIAFRLQPLKATYRRRYHADDPSDDDFAWADVVFLDHDMCQQDYRGGIVLEPDPKRNCPNPVGKSGPLAACGCPSGANLARRMAEGGGQAARRGPHGQPAGRDGDGSDAGARRVSGALRARIAVARHGLGQGSGVRGGAAMGDNDVSKSDAPTFVGLTPPPPNPNATGSCHCGAVTVHFDEVAGAGANAKEVRAKWPRGRCGTCRTTVYASTMHFIAGDW